MLHFRVFQQFQVTFNNPPKNFISYIHGEILYRVGTSGVIPQVDGADFDAQIGDSNRFQESEIFQIIGTNINYYKAIRMNWSGLNNNENPEVQYKFVCYLINPHYYQSS